MSTTPRQPLILGAAFMFAAGVAQAHPGHSHSDIPSLIRHPFAGPEHLLGSLAVGLAVGSVLYLTLRRVRMPVLARWASAIVVAAGVTLLGLSV